MPNPVRHLFRFIFGLKQRLRVGLGYLITIERGQIDRINSSKKLTTCSASQELVLPEVKTISNNPDPKTHQAQKIHFPAVNLFSIPNVKLTGKHAVPLLNGKFIITEHIFGRIFAMTNATDISVFRVLRQSLNTTQFKQGNFFSINSVFSHNYYHWLTECLPCIEYYEKCPKETILLLPSNLNSWQRSSLELICGENLLYQQQGNNNLTVSQLYMTSWHKPKHGFLMPPSPGTIHWLQERVFSKLKNSTTQTAERIFISRADSKKEKRIANEQEIAKLLANYGFEIFVLSELSFNDQIILFKNAKIVIGTHGAGLTNLMFADQPTVIEIFPTPRHVPCYSSITHIIGGDYYSYIADTANFNGTAEVDLNKFKVAIEMLLV